MFTMEIWKMCYMDTWNDPYNAKFHVIHYLLSESVHYKDFPLYLQTKFNIVYWHLCHEWKKAEHCADFMQNLIANQCLISITDNGKKFPIKNAYMFARE